MVEKTNNKNISSDIVSGEIQKQNDLLVGLLKHSPLAVVINDLEKKIAVVNPAFEKLFGY